MRPAERREERQNGGGDDPDREESPTKRQRVARAVVQLRALVAKAGTSVFDGGGFCDECVTEEQCVQDDVRLASYAAELEGEAREAYNVLLIPVWITEMMLTS